MGARRSKQSIFASATGMTAIDYSGGDVEDVDYDAIWVGGDGNLAITTKDGDEVILTGLLGGTILPVSVTQITQTGSTATGLFGMIW